MTRSSADRTSGINTSRAALRGDLSLSLERERIYHRLVAELSQLSDGELAALGCDRWGIPQLAREAARLAVPR